MNKNGFDSNHMHANKKVFFTSLIFLIIFLACWGFTGFFNQKKVSEVEQEYVFVDADQMITDYQSNKVNADSKYLNKPVAVSGIITSIDSDNDYPIILSIVTNPHIQTSFVMAVGDQKFVKDANNVFIGNQVRLKCFGGGYILDIPKIYDCKIALINNTNTILSDDNYDAAK